MTDFNALLNSITDQDIENPVIADLVRQMYDPSEYSDAVEQAAAEQVNECLMRMVEEEKARRFASHSPDCDLFNSVSIVEIQKDKKVAVCDLTPANAGQKGRGQLDSKEVAVSASSEAQGNRYGDSKEVAPSCELPAQGNKTRDDKEVAGAGNGNANGESKQVASPHTVPVASVPAIKGDIVWMQAQLWDNSDRERCVKYYSKYVIKRRRPSGEYYKHTLYLNFTSHRSFVKNYKTLLTERQEWEKPVAQFYEMWRQHSIDEQKETLAARPPLIGLAMSDPKSLSSIDQKGSKSQLKVTTKKGKEVRNDYWPGYVGILFWDECDNPHIWLGIHDRREWMLPLIDGKHTADWEPKTDAQRRSGRRPCDFIGYWHQEKAEQELLLEEVRRKRRR